MSERKSQKSRTFLIAALGLSVAIAGTALYVLRNNLFVTDHQTTAARFEAPDFSAPGAPTNTATAIFAGGCFWCVESDFDHVPGVLETISGYTGGTTIDPTYKEVVTETTGHYEAVRITYDPSIVSYAQLVDVFFHSVDPTDPGGQFCDRGHSYRTAIFATDQTQFELATNIKEAIDATGELPAPIVTPILNAAPFYEAETYHQDYHLKNTAQYSYYRFGCGRDRRVSALWGDQAHRGLEKEKKN